MRILNKVYNYKGSDFVNATNILKKIKNILGKILWIIMILLVIALVGAIVAISFALETLIIDVMLVPPMIVFLGIGLNYFIARLCGHKIYNTGWVVDGRTVFDIKVTPKYYKRKMVIDFIQCLLFIAYLIKFVLSLKGEELAWAIAGIIVSLVGAVLYFIVGLSSIEKSKLEQKDLDSLS